MIVKFIVQINFDCLNRNARQLIAVRLFVCLR